MEAVALFGPTGLGKTELAVALATSLRDRGESPVAISADSMQVYRELPIITGVASVQQREQLEHRLVGFVPVSESFDVARFAELAHAEIDGVLGDGRRPIVVGGTGLYLRAALADLDLMPPPLDGARSRLEAELAEIGQPAMFARLRAADPALAEQIDSANSRRTIRALEAIEQGVSAASRSENRLWTSEMRRPTQLFALTMDRELLYEKIDARVDQMVAAGAIEEVRAAAAAGASATARQALGFDELMTGDVETLKRNTRRYAKRQLTWLRKLSGAHRIDVTTRSTAEVIDAIEVALGLSERPMI